MALMASTLSCIFLLDFWLLPEFFTEFLSRQTRLLLVSVESY